MPTSSVTTIDTKPRRTWLMRSMTESQGMLESLEFVEVAVFTATGYCEVWSVRGSEL